MEQEYISVAAEKQKKTKVLLIGNNMARLITVKCDLNSAKWCFQMFYKPLRTVRTEYICSFFSCEFCQLDLLLTAGE